MNLPWGTQQEGRNQDQGLACKHCVGFPLLSWWDVSWWLITSIPLMVLGPESPVPISGRREELSPSSTACASMETHNAERGGGLVCFHLKTSLPLWAWRHLLSGAPGF